MKKWLRVTIAIAFVGGLILWIAFTLSGNQKKSASEIVKELEPVPFTVTAVYARVKEFRDSIGFRGSIEPLELFSIYSETDGKVIFSRIEKGLLVSKGQLLAKLDNSIRSAGDSSNRVNFDKAKADYERLESLYSLKNASLIEVENARTQMLAAKQQLKLSRTQMSQSNIMAPASGVIVEKKTNQGDYLQPGAVLGTIAVMSKVVARVFVPENAVVQLQRGQKAYIKADVYAGKSFTGQVKNIVPLATDAKTYPVEIEITNNTTHPLLGSMSVTVNFESKGVEKALVIPRTALTGDVNNPAIYVIDSARNTRKVTIRTGRSFGQFIEVTQALKEGEIVVVSGQQNISPGKVLKDYVIQQ
ncbi:MAG: efflux RND transporter periplasmic adaptor subunit [Chitinophagaceae bacterium]|nr:efflux RND transporter periplasmic adaptor subunit [Chitinophagaceae bacterium]